MLKRMLCFALLLAAALAAHAQGDFYRRPSPFAGRTILTLALFEEVRTELKTTADENTKLDGLVDKMGGEIQDAIQGANGDFASVMPTIMKINAKYDDLALAALTPDQDARLKQLFIQYNGNGAISNPTVEKDLGLTDDQKAKVRAAQDASFQKSVGAGGPPDPDTMKKNQEELGAELLKILNDDQKSKFQAMQGAKFEFKKE